MNWACFDIDSLGSFNLSSLTRVGGDLSVYRNPSLAQCLVDALVAQVEAEGELSLFDNDEDCTCWEDGEGLVAICREGMTLRHEEKLKNL